jgi:hypothetical protein
MFKLNNNEKCKIITDELREYNNDINFALIKYNYDLITQKEQICLYVSPTGLDIDNLFIIVKDTIDPYWIVSCNISENYHNIDSLIRNLHEPQYIDICPQMLRKREEMRIKLELETINKLYEEEKRLEKIKANLIEKETIIDELLIKLNKEIQVNKDLQIRLNDTEQVNKDLQIRLNDTEQVNKDLQNKQQYDNNGQANKDFYYKRRSAIQNILNNKKNSVVWKK